MYQGSSSSRSSSSRLGSSRTYEQGEKYMQTLEMRSKKLNAHTRHNLSSLPKLYAKAEELNRKLAASSMLLNYSNSLDGDCRRSSAATPTHHDSSSLDDFDQHNGSHRELTSRSGSRKDSEIYLKEHKKAVLKKTLVVSQCLDQDVKSRLEHIKYGSVSSLGAYAINGHHNTFGSIPNENLMNGSINSSRVAAPAATSEANSRRYSMIDVNYIKKSPREEREDSVVDNDDVISNSENDNDLFSGSSELQMNNRDEVAPLRRSSRSRLGDFASNLSKEGQYALLRSLEDTLVNEIEVNRPDLAEKLPALKNRGDLQHPRRTSLNLEQMQKRNAMILQQIETVTELLDELRDYEKKKPSGSPAKKQIHFSDSSDTHNERLDSFSSETSGKSSSSAFKSALKNEPLNILPSRRQRKSIMSNCSLPEAEVSSLVAVDKVTHLLSKYIYLKKHLE